ncbi:MAG: hypothetical protein HY906_16935 [Deltaproteobacteria bacterium]|nr:hypothetical protein [Deltaproteobacteria bacterium]
MLVHLTAHSVSGIPLAEWPSASRLWRWLRRAFPHALAAVLMPNHPHLILDTPEPERARTTLALILAALGRRDPSPDWSRAAPRWEPVPRPEEIPDLKHLRRLVRYLALNPCRDRLVRDPLEWEWSTHRDVVGAITDPWISAARLAAAFGALPVAPAVFAARWHAYVSGDPHCDVNGTPPPRPVKPTEMPRWPLGRIVAAATAATRSLAAAIRGRTLARRLFVQLAWRHGWRHTPTLAQACGVTVQAVGRLRAHPDAELVAAGDMCLGDDRLLRRRLDARQRHGLPTGTGGVGGTRQNLSVMPARP